MTDWIQKHQELILGKGQKEQGEEQADSDELAEKGGPGSGHHGHAGRPGQRGGSAPGKGGGVSASEQANSRWRPIGSRDKLPAGTVVGIQGISSVIAIRPGLPEGGNGSNNQPRIELAQFLISQFELLHHSRGIILY